MALIGARIAEICHSGAITVFISRREQRNIVPSLPLHVDRAQMCIECKKIRRDCEPVEFLLKFLNDAFSCILDTFGLCLKGKDGIMLYCS